VYEHASHGREKLLKPHIGNTPNRVGVASAMTGLTKQEHARLMTVTDQNVRELLREPAEEI
jgi:hypothetical protein